MVKAYFIDVERKRDAQEDHVHRYNLCLSYEVEIFKMILLYPQPAAK